MKTGPRQLASPLQIGASNSEDECTVGADSTCAEGEFCQAGGSLFYCPVGDTSCREPATCQPTPELEDCTEDGGTCVDPADEDCRDFGCGEGEYCGFCWSRYICLPDGAVC